MTDTALDTVRWHCDLDTDLTPCDLDTGLTPPGVDTGLTPGGVKGLGWTPVPTPGGVKRCLSPVSTPYVKTETMLQYVHTGKQQIPRALVC